MASRISLLKNQLSGSKKLETVVIKDSSPPIGPFVPAKKVKAGANLVYVSGQVGIDSKTNELPDCVVEQARNAMASVEKILKASNSSFENVFKAIVYLTDMGNFAKVNEEYARWFKSGNYPARVCFAVQGLPRGAKVEIEVIAVEDN